VFRDPKHRLHRSLAQAVAAPPPAPAQPLPHRPHEPPGLSRPRVRRTGLPGVDDG
jgi:hypothetical protein